MRDFFTLFYNIRREIFKKMKQLLSLTYAGPGYKMLGVKKIICVFLIFASLDAYAYVDRQTAVARVMNKAAGKAQTISLPVGKTTEHEKLAITVRACKQTDPFAPEDFFVFAEIDKNPDGRIFSGWMSRSEPAENPLQDADYDFWLVKCE
jgi:hypothetical protein